MIEKHPTKERTTLGSAFVGYGNTVSPNSKGLWSVLPARGHNQEKHLRSCYIMLSSFLHCFPPLLCPPSHLPPPLQLAYQLPPPQSLAPQLLPSLHYLIRLEAKDLHPSMLHMYSPWMCPVLWQLPRLPERLLARSLIHLGGLGLGAAYGYHAVSHLLTL